VKAYSELKRSAENRTYILERLGTFTFYIKKKKKKSIDRPTNKSVSKKVVNEKAKWDENRLQAKSAIYDGV